MNRRYALQRVALLMGGVVSAPTLIAILDGCKSNSSASGAGFNLSKDQQSLLAEIAEVIIPKTNTPGAKEAGVGPFIEKMMKDCYSEVQQKHFLEGLDTLESEAKKLGGGFVSLSAENKIAVMKTMQGLAKTEQEKIVEKTKEVDTESGLVKENLKKKDEVEIPTPFFKLAKELTLFGYFTSEKGAKEALDFVPIPGRFDACIKIKPGTKAYAIS